MPLALTTLCVLKGVSLYGTVTIKGLMNTKVTSKSLEHKIKPKPKRNNLFSFAINFYVDLIPGA